MAARRKRKATLPPLGGEPADFQERHSPTEPVMVKITGQRQAVQCRRRRADSRIWDALSVEQADAATAIEWCYRFRTAGLGAKVQRFDREAMGVSRDEVHPIRIERLRAYDEWRDTFAGAEAVVAIVVEGEGLSEQDRRLRKRNGWAKANLHDGLQRYHKIVNEPAIQPLAPSGKR